MWCGLIHISLYCDWWPGVCDGLPREPGRSVQTRLPEVPGPLLLLSLSGVSGEYQLAVSTLSLNVSQDLHYTEPTRNDQDPVRQGIVPMETPFIMDNVMDDGMAACSLM